MLERIPSSQNDKDPVGMDNSQAACKAIQEHNADTLDVADVKVAIPEATHVDSQSEGSCCRLCSDFLNHTWTTLTMPPMVATLLGVVAILIPPLQDALFEPSGSLRFAGAALETIAAPGVACFTFVMAASLVPSDKLRQKFTATSWPMSPKALIALLLTRLVVIPALFFSCWYLFENYLHEALFHAPPSTPRMVGLVALIESSAPAANMPVVFLAKMNKHDTATRLAFSYIFMYPLSVFTLTGCSTLALSFTE